MMSIPPPLDLVVEFLCRYVPLCATIGRLVPACAPFFVPFSASDQLHYVLLNRGGTLEQALPRRQNLVRIRRSLSSDATR